jgi:hypothetical protein
VSRQRDIPRLLSVAELEKKNRQSPGGDSWQLDVRVDADILDERILALGIPGIDARNLTRTIRRFEQALKKHYLAMRTIKSAMSTAAVEKRMRNDTRNNKAVHWERAARRCIMNKAQPSAWVAAQFTGEMPFVLPSALGTTGAADRWRKYKNRDSEGLPTVADMLRQFWFAYVREFPGTARAAVTVGHLRTLAMLSAYNIPECLLVVLSGGDAEVLEAVGDTGLQQLRNHPQLYFEFAAAGISTEAIQRLTGVKDEAPSGDDDEFSSFLSSS